MSDLERITTEYVPLEDRIRVSGQISGERTVTMWLTQRMLILLLPYLFDWLNNRTKSISKTNSQRDGSLNTIMQTFAQEAAITDLLGQNQTPVQSSNNNSNILIHTIDITAGDAAVRIGFKSESRDEDFRLINLTLEQAPLRQWLHILHSQSQKGEWVLKLWPDWIREAEEEKLNPKILAH
jgi:hypothetical protein